MVTNDVGFDVAVTRARLQQSLVDNGLVPATEPPTTPSMVAWGHVGLHGVPTKHLVDGEWVDAPCCSISPCKAAGVSFAIFELDQYLSEAALQRSELVDAIDRIVRERNRFASAAHDDLAAVEAHSAVEKTRVDKLQAAIRPKFFCRGARPKRERRKSSW